MQQLCGNSYKLAILDSSETNYIPFERSKADNLRGQHYCHSTGTFWSPIAGMTSQTNPLYLISMRGWLYWLMGRQRLED